LWRWRLDCGVAIEHVVDERVTVIFGRRLVQATKVPAAKWAKAGREPKSQASWAMPAPFTVKPAARANAA
jgi:hypothetical protein